MFILPDKLKLNIIRRWWYYGFYELYNWKCFDTNTSFIYILGSFLTGLENIKDKYIPLVLLTIGIGFSVAIIGFSVDAIIQGILITGTTVLSNQLIKQSKKDE